MPPGPTLGWGWYTWSARATGTEMLINAEPVTLGVESFQTPAKGGIARAPAC